MLSSPPTFFQGIIEASDAAIVGVDREGRITVWNAGAEHLFGYTAAQAIGEPSSSIIPPSDRAVEEEALRRALDGRRVERIETTRAARDGRTVPVVVMIAPIHDSGGRFLGISYIFRDIGERQRMERQAFHLAALVQSSNDAIVSMDLEGIVQSWNRAAERLFGYEAAEVVGRSIREIIPAERWAEEDELLRRVRAGERIEHFEMVRLREDGTFIQISLTASPIRDANGAIVGVSRIGRDVSLQRRLEHEANRLGAIVESSDDAIISKDLNGVVQTWNRAAERMFGYSADEAIGRSITFIIPEDRLTEEDEVLGRIRRGLRIDHYETVRRRKDGALVPISLTVSPIHDHTGRVTGASKTARDLSALRAYATTLEETVRERTAELETANRQLESFAHSVSHDLRAPLRGMHGLAHALIEDYGHVLDERARDYATRIVAEAGLLDRLILDLLAYSRLARIDVALEPVDVGEVVEAALHNLDEDIRTTRASVRVEPGLPRLRANRAVLVQVLTNLISNAVKFGGDQPTVRVHAERDGARARIWVEDEGIGISPKHHERIFRAFERLHGIERYPGTGIGLAIVHKAIERLGGRVGVESEEGKGSRFWFELARAEAA